jgi:hypothetical protein
MKPLLMIIPAVILVSGCTIPGTGITFPCPWCNTMSLENDIVVIKELTAIPSSVTAPQQIRLTASIQNRGEKEFSKRTDSGIETGSNGIKVELFDYCDGLFKKNEGNAYIETACPDSPPRRGETACEIKELLPQEIKTVSWVLVPSENTKLVTPCELKVSVTYPYRTSGLTTIHFINSEEYANQLARGIFSPKTSVVSLGDGPVKAWYEVKDKQPIAAAKEGTSTSQVPVALNIENRGSGFVMNSEVVIKSTNIFDSPFQGGCGFERGDKERLIQKKRMLPCWIQQLQDCSSSSQENCVAKESTHQLIVGIEYMYEFRKSAKVTVEPQYQV